MAFQPISLFFLLLFVCTAAAQRRPSNITIGSSLTPTTTASWPSASGLYAFGFFPQNVDGYAVGVFLSDKTVVWTANRDNPTVPNDVVSLQLTTDGRLILRRRQGLDVNVINPATAIASASMLDNGNFVLYDSDSRIIWQSFDHATTTLLPGQRLPPGEELFSSASETDYGRGIFRLKMQDDGNLVQYPVNTPDTAPYACYASGTNTAGSNVSLNLDNDGRLYLLNGSAFLRNITNGGFRTQDSLSLMRLDVGGIFRLYSLSLNPLGNLTERWSSNGDACVPKGNSVESTRSAFRWILRRNVSVFPASISFSPATTPPAARAPSRRRAVRNSTIDSSTRSRKWKTQYGRKTRTKF